MKTYIEGVTCPACEDTDLHPTDALNAYSRFASHYICSACGAREAFRGFFWRSNCLAHGIRFNEGQREREARNAILGDGP
jgi:Zn ribbon nucleic-acid-binding protein